MDINNSEKVSSPSSLDVNETETVAISSSGPVDNKSENLQDSKPARVGVQNMENGETKNGLDLQLVFKGSESNTSKIKDESLTLSSSSSSELVTKKADKIPVASVLLLVNAEVKEFSSEQHNETNEASAGTAASKNDEEQEPVFSGSSDHVPLQNEAVIAESVPSEVNVEREELPSNNKKGSNNLLTDHEKQNSENVPELFITIPGLTEVALGKCWNECELLLKKNLVFGCPEIKQLQYCKPYEDVIDKAVEKGFIDLIKLLIHNGYPCETVLLYSLKYNKEDIIYLVIQKGADVNCKGSNGEIPLLLSVKMCSFEVTRLLISKGADVNCKGSEEETPLLLSVKKCSYEEVQLLISKGADVNLKGSNGEIPLLLSVKMCSFEVMQLLISKGADVNCKGSGGETPLLLSAKKCSPKVVQLLLLKGADINAKNSNNESVLHIAAEHGNYDVVKFLLDDINDGNSSHKIRDNIDLTNIHGRSALHLSVDNNHYNVAELLLDRGADIDLKDNHGCTALHICCECGKKSHLNVFTLLYERHANINERNNNKETPLILAVRSGNTPIVKCLLNDPYCDVEAENIVGCTALKYVSWSTDEIVGLIKTRLSLQ